MPVQPDDGELHDSGAKEVAAEELDFVKTECFLESTDDEPILILFAPQSLDIRADDEAAVVHGIGNPNQ